MNYKERSLQLHKKMKGKLEVRSKVAVDSRDDLSLAYTPGVAEVSREIVENPEKVWEYTPRSNMVAIVSDGSAVLGLGNIGPEAAYPVMEGKAVLLKEFGGVDAWPIVLATQDVDEIVETVERIAPGFGGINLEDISAPRCFEIEERLQDLGIPVFHDDQHGTAVVVLAGLLNALKVVEKDKTEVKIVINGAGAAGIAVYKMLRADGFKNIVMCDSRGVVSIERDDLNPYKQMVVDETQANAGVLSGAIVGADVFIGISVANILTVADVKAMNSGAILFTMANPDPEITPEKAREGGAKVIATGRSDYPNQVNNVLAFPGIFRGALDVRALRITEGMKVAAAHTLAKLIEKPTVEEILPEPIDKGVVPAVSEAVAKAWKKENT